MSLNDLHKKYPWNSMKKFWPVAQEHGFSKQDVIKFFQTNVVKDKLKINQRKYFLPIYGHKSGVYQFDTLIQSRNARIPAFLVFIEINSKKGYVYSMKNKGVDEVLRRLNDFYRDASPKPVEMTSDQDSAYMNDRVINFMLDHNINYFTTDDNNHNILGVVNRFIKTLRDHNNGRDFNDESLQNFVRAYNNTEHSATGKKPNSFNTSDQHDYIAKMEKIEHQVRSKDDFNLKPGQKVRIIIDRPVIGKKRTNLSENYYIIDSCDGNGYHIRARNGAVGYYPRHKLVPATGSEKFAETLQNYKRAIVSKIISYNASTNKYKIMYESGDVEEIQPKNLRESNPTRAGVMEQQFWKDKNNIPTKIKRFL